MAMINSGERGFGLPKFSLKERERRWNGVRKLMRQGGVDAILGLPNQSHWAQFQADVRYLTQIGGNQTEAAVVFPEEGEVAAFVRGSNEVEWWKIAQDWVKDLRMSRSRRRFKPLVSVKFPLNWQNPSRRACKSSGSC